MSSWPRAISTLSFLVSASTFSAVQFNGQNTTDMDSLLSRSGADFSNARVHKFEKAQFGRHKYIDPWAEELEWQSSPIHSDVFTSLHMLPLIERSLIPHQNTALMQTCRSLGRQFCQTDNIYRRCCLSLQTFRANHVFIHWCWVHSRFTFNAWSRSMTCDLLLFLRPYSG